MSAPVTYISDFLALSADGIFHRLRTELAWVRHGDGTVPRLEYYTNTRNVPYTYGKGEFARTYAPQPTHEAIEEVRSVLQAHVDAKFEVCFLNRYLNQSDHLGWHADDSPEMDDARPIAIVSFGVEREIWFRPLPRPKSTTYVFDGAGELAEVVPPAVEKLTLGHGSLCVMAPGMQDTHQHRIPKSSRQCSERISLTFRGYVL